MTRPAAGIKYDEEKVSPITLVYEIEDGVPTLRGWKPAGGDEGQMEMAEGAQIQVVAFVERAAIRPVEEQEGE